MPFDLEEVYLRYYGGVLRTVLRYVDNLADAEDLVQDIFLKLPQGFKPEKGGVGTWLGIIVKRELWNYKKKQIERKALTELPIVDLYDEIDTGAILLSSEPLPDEAAIAREREDAVRTIIGTFTGKTRAVFDLILQGHTNHEIALALGISQSNVSSVIFNQKRVFREQLNFKL